MARRECEEMIDMANTWAALSLMFSDDGAGDDGADDVVDAFDAGLFRR